MQNDYVGWILVAWFPPIFNGIWSVDTVADRLDTRSQILIIPVEFNGPVSANDHMTETGRIVSEF